MRITKLLAPNFKGRHIELDLDPMNLIVGDNFIGKTAITEAITVGLLGYLPKLGSSNAATFSLCSDKQQLAVLVDFDSKKSNHIVLTRSDSGSVSKTENLSFQVPSVLLDTHEYFG